MLVYQRVVIEVPKFPLNRDDFRGSEQFWWVASNVPQIIHIKIVRIYKVYIYTYICVRTIAKKYAGVVSSGSLATMCM